MDTEMNVVDPAQPRPGLRRRIVSRWRSITAWLCRHWADVRPGPEARRGAAWGSILAALIGSIIAGRYLGSGFGWWIDLLFCLAVGALLILVSAALVPVLLTIIRRLPMLVSGLIFGSVLVVMLAFMPIGIGVGPIPCLFAGFLGATVATFFSAGRQPRRRRSQSGYSYSHWARRLAKFSFSPTMARWKAW